MKKQSDHLVINEAPKIKKGELNLFKAHGDIALTKEDAPFVLSKISPYFDMGNTPEQIEASKAMQTVFLSSLKDVGMGKKQFIRALKHAFKTKTYGNKDFLTSILSYEKTIKYFTWNEVLKLLNDQKISSTGQMTYVKFMNGYKAYIYNSDFSDGIMERVYEV